MAMARGQRNPEAPPPRKVADRFHASDLRPHGCSCSTQYVPVPAGDGWWSPIWEPDVTPNPLRRWNRLFRTGRGTRDPLSTAPTLAKDLAPCAGATARGTILGERHAMADDPVPLPAPLCPGTPSLVAQSASRLAALPDAPHTRLAFPGAYATAGDCQAAPSRRRADHAWSLSRYPPTRADRWRASRGCTPEVQSAPQGRASLDGGLRPGRP